ncbi:Uncharacterised protein [Serratia grimesii]|nr:Uncharacterised protein [Serratia grimesii]CAI2482453.1 Uncharacterised protein [Serratia grimesii]SUI31290.1 Uncharacterised protein [Serratia grimesii]
MIWNYLILIAMIFYVMFFGRCYIAQKYNDIIFVFLLFH